DLVGLRPRRRLADPPGARAADVRELLVTSPDRAHRGELAHRRKVDEDRADLAVELLGHRVTAVRIDAGLDRALDRRESILVALADVRAERLAVLPRLGRPLPATGSA